MFKINKTKQYDDMVIISLIVEKYILIIIDLNATKKYLGI